MQPQTAVTMTTMQPQTGVTMQPQVPVAMPTAYPGQPRPGKYFKTVRGLAITEVVLGSICILLGVVIIGVRSGRYNNSAGEGLWCGVWIIVAGALGVPAVGRNSNRCLIICHMAFSIVGAVFSGTLFGISTASIFIHYYTVDIVMEVLLCLMSFTSMILLIISASYCCYLVPGCCGPYAAGQPQVIYLPANTQQPVMLHQAGMPVGMPAGMPVAQTYVHGYQPVPQVVPPQPIPFQQPAMAPTAQNPSQTKEQEALSCQGNQAPASSFPPSYSNI